MVRLPAPTSSSSVSFCPGLSSGCRPRWISSASSRVSPSAVVTTALTWPGGRAGQAQMAAVKPGAANAGGHVAQLARTRNGLLLHRSI